MASVGMFLLVVGLEFCVARKGALVAVWEKVARDNWGSTGPVVGEFGV